MTSPQIIDDKSPHCIPFILTHLTQHHLTHPTTPFIIALNGIQGSGKTTLVHTLSNILRQPPHNLSTLVFSIDDFYLPYTSQKKLASENADNALVQYRGEPGTHDVELLNSVFGKLVKGEEVGIPGFDKGAMGGKGDRIEVGKWEKVNEKDQKPIQVIIFEGWCVGFHPLPQPTLESIHSESQNPNSPQKYKTLQNHPLKSLQFINTALQAYQEISDLFNVFIHIDAEDLEWVYEWREEQEEKLRRERGVEGAMTKEEVGRFVDGYFPAYELFVEGVREGVFKGKGEEWKGRQLRLVVGRDRRVKEVVVI